MSNTQFEVDELYKISFPRKKSNRPVYLVKLLQKTGMNQKTAEFSLYAIFIVCFTLTCIIIINQLFPDIFSKKATPDNLPIEVRMEREKFEYGKK